ncbi:MAG: efflux RND transporter periplasmic adaptor subunit [Deltaproteobacteria bacterium]|nr:efflux RND transporter periplasmic adaptor subunit [Deltaproteobacteria bacterium]
MRVMKVVLICMAVTIPVAFGAFYYGRNVESHRSAMEIHEAENHGEREHEEHEEQDHESLKSEPVHQDEDHILLSEDQVRALGIVTAKAGPGTLETVLTLPGEIVLNDDNVALVTPYVSGYVKEIRKRQGDPVRRGEVMAVLESRELADAGSAYLSARERLTLAVKNFEREESLWRKKISPELDYLESKMALSAARIAVRSAQQKLMALGLSKGALDRLPRQADASLTRYEILSPLNGQVLEKNLSLGEMVESTDSVYRVADMNTVWVRINLLQRQLPFLKKDMAVHIQGDGPMASATGRLTFIGPLVGKETRTANGRATLSNPDGEWRPGLFVSARILAGEKHIPFLVPKRAVQRIGGESVVFVPGEGGFEERVVTTGRSDENHVEITAGLSPEDRYVIDGAFELKATLTTDAMGSHAGHGH